MKTKTMLISQHSRICLTIAVLAILCLAATPDISAQAPELEFIVGDTVIGANPTLNIILRNYIDTVESFRFWLQLDRPDVARFITDGVTLSDTTWWQCIEVIDWDCVDSVEVTDSVHNNPAYPWDMMYIDTRISYLAALDTVNTLIGGWEYVDARSIGGQGYDLFVQAEADRDSPPVTPGIGYPQYGDVPLIKLNLEALPLPEGEDFAEARVLVMTDQLDYFLFRDEHGDSLCVYPHDVPDTTFFRCNIWVPDGEDSICVNYERVYEPPYDSIDIRMFSVPYLDTTCFRTQDGSIIIGEPWMSGDANQDGYQNLLDMLLIIQELYTPGGQELPVFNLDFNCDCEGNLLDILAMIDWLYYYHEPAHPCTMPEWESKCGPIE